jgi:hypothetical protein
MRFSTVAAAVCLGLSALAGGLATLPSPARAQGQGTTPPGTAAPASAGTGMAAAGGSSGDAAARHAKRTECLKQARVKKLIGAQKTAYIKNCIAAP